MLRVVVYKVKPGSEKAPRQLASLELVETERHSAVEPIASYRGTAFNAEGARIRRAEVLRHDRSKPVWTLIRNMLENMGY